MRGEQPSRAAKPGGLLVGPAAGAHTSGMTALPPTALSVTLNGEPHRLPAATTVAGLLAGLGFDARKVAVERNEAIVPRSLYATTELAEGDALEIVHFIGGG